VQSMQTETTLARVAEHLSMLEVGCRKCERYGRLSIARLIAEHGAGQGLKTGCSAAVGRLPEA
jgi:hypothetical protein